MGIWREKSHWKDLSRREDGAHSGFPSGQATAEDHLQKFRCSQIIEARGNERHHAQEEGLQFHRDRFGT